MLQHFCSKGRTSLQCQKIPGYEWAHLPFWENCMLLIAAANQSTCFSFSTANYSLKLHKKHSIKAAAHGSDNFTEHYIIRLVSAHEFVLPPLLWMHHPQWSPPIYLNIANYTSFSHEQCTNSLPSTRSVQYLIHEHILAQWCLNTWIASLTVCLCYTAFFITHLPMFYIGVHYQGHTSNQTVIWKSIDHISLKKQKKGHYTKSLKVIFQPIPGLH